MIQKTWQQPLQAVPAGLAVDVADHENFHSLKYKLPRGKNSTPGQLLPRKIRISEQLRHFWFRESEPL